MSHHNAHHRLSTLQGALIVLGTSVGGGMLGLPVMTSSSGFLPSAFMLIVSWFFMTFTGLVLGELSCRKKHNANLLSLYSSAFPKIGGPLSTCVYFLLFYSLMVAYLLALSRMLFDTDTFSGVGGSLQGYIVAVAIFGVFFLFGLRSWLSRINGSLVLVMAVSYVTFFVMATQIVHSERLQVTQWTYALQTLPLIFTSFGFQGTVPSLASLMGYERKPLFKAILIGTGVTLVLYLLWQAIIIGAIPLEGYMGLIYAKERGLDAITPLAFHLPSHMGPSLIRFGKIFAFSAITTSLIGVSIGMHDFIGDLFKVQHKTPTSRMVLALAVYVPSLVFSLLFPGAFLTALSLAGGVGCAFLLGAMPSLTAYLTTSLKSDRPQEERETEGGWVGLVIRIVTHPYTLLFSTCFFAVEVLEEVLILGLSG